MQPILTEITIYRVSIYAPIIGVLWVLIGFIGSSILKRIVYKNISNSGESVSEIDKAFFESLLMLFSFLGLIVFIYIFIVNYIKCNKLT